MKIAPLLIAIAAFARAESGSFTIHMILHAIGEERYEISKSPEGMTLDTTFEYSDRGNKRTTVAKLTAAADYTPRDFTIKDRPEAVRVEGDQATVKEALGSRTFATPKVYFTIFGPAPFAVQEMMMRYWIAHGKPASLPMLRANPAADAIRIEAAGRESITVNGKPVALERFTIANLMFGREIVWMTANGNLAAAMTFAGGLPMEAVRTEFEPALEQLYRSGVGQEMADLKAIEK